MSSVCSDQKHKLHQLISPKKHLDLPPRRQLKLYDLSPNLEKEGMFPEDDDELDPYSADHFRMYEFKVRRCTRSRSHDWTDCPFAHPGEKARRRDPRRFHYSGEVCPEFRRGGCSRGDSCKFAHGVFECWLHPSRYRTEACKDGKNCKRKVCFFAHTPRQLRTPCDASYPCCCLLRHSVSSPTSTLLGMSHLSPPMSPSLSPPLSPAKQRRCSERMLRSSSGGVVSYKDVLNELMSSLEAMNFNEAAALCSPLSRGRSRANTHWIDASFEDDQQQQQQQLILSPSTPSPSGLGNLFDGNFSRNNSGFGGQELDAKMMNENGNGFGSSDPDLGWVNDLLM